MRFSFAASLLGFHVLSACSSGGITEPPAPPVITDPTPTPDPPPTGGADAGPKVLESDVVVYGGTPSGILAAVEAGRLHKKVVLVEPSAWLGGMVAGGLSKTDIGDTRASGGLSAEFFATAHAHYADPAVGKTVSNLKTGLTQDTYSTYVVEPHVAENVFVQMLAGAGVTVVKSTQLVSVQKVGAKIASITLSDGTERRAAMFIDSTYEGDLMAQAGVSYTWGREAQATYCEENGGVQAPYPPLAPSADGTTHPIDPFVVAGDPNSGLLPFVTPGAAPVPGSSDKKVMAYNYRICVSNAPDRTPFTSNVPSDYDPNLYEGALRYLQAIQQLHHGSTVGLAGHFMSAHGVYFVYPPSAYPNHPGETFTKIDVNGGAPFGTDMVDIVNGYPDGTPAERALIAARVERYTRGLFYFMSVDPRLPAAVHDDMAAYGLCPDEFADTKNWPHQLYVREGRRMLGAYVMTESDLKGTASSLASCTKPYQPFEDSIALGMYGLDSHMVELLAVDGKLMSEGNDRAEDVSLKGPYPISYRALTPMPTEAENLLVSVTISASHTAVRAMRMEPTYMNMGHAAGAAASLAIDRGTTVQALPYDVLKTQLLADGQHLRLP